MLSAKNDNGKNVDWCFMYKLPSGIQPKGKRKTKGNEYLYYDPDEKKPLHLSPYRLGTGPKGALYHTFRQLFGKPSKRTGWIFYNDEYPADMSPYKLPANYWKKYSRVKNGKLTDAKEKALLVKLMIKEGLIGKDDKPTVQQLLTFRAAREALIEKVKTIQNDLLAAWKKGKGDWPAGVKPGINSGSARKKDRGEPVNHGTNGHCKGALAFDLDTDTAFWLSHSTPRIPALKTPPSKRFFYPEYADQYAQTFICITLDSVATAGKIAKILSAQHEPQVFGCRLPDDVTEKSKKWKDLWGFAQGSVPPNYGKAYTSKHKRKAPENRFKFCSKAGKEFRLFAKSGAWFDDFWIDLVGPNLPNYKGGKGVDLRVETWRRLTTTATLPRNPHTDPGKEKLVYGSHDFTTKYKDRDYHHEFFEKEGKHVVDEVTNIDLGMLKDPGGLLTSTKGAMLTGYLWSYTRDHAKWAISEEVEGRGVKTVELHDGTTLADEQGTVSDWVVVADMNRMTSQEKRGGGAICFHEPLLWHELNEIERISGKIT